MTNFIFGKTLASSPFKNKIINGEFNVAQRAVSAPMPTVIVYTTVDRWAFNAQGPINGTNSQVVSGLDGFEFALKIQKNPGTSNTSGPFFHMTKALESMESRVLAGKTMTFSYYAKAGANLSGQFVVLFGVGTGVDELPINIGGGWTNQTFPVNKNQVITTSWVRYTETFTLPTNTNQVGIRFSFAPSGTAGADDSVYITGVQLEESQVATDFQHRPFGVELDLSKRYYQEIIPGEFISMGMAQGSTTVKSGISFNQKMRKVPSLGFSNPYQMTVENNVGTITLSASNISVDSARLNGVPSISLPTGKSVEIFSSVNKITIDAEL